MYDAAITNAGTIRTPELWEFGLNDISFQLIDSFTPKLQWPSFSPHSTGAALKQTTATATSTLRSFFHQLFRYLSPYIFYILYSFWQEQQCCYLELPFHAHHSKTPVFPKMTDFVKISIRALPRVKWESPPLTRHAWCVGPGYQEDIITTGLPMEKDLKFWRLPARRQDLI